MIILVLIQIGGLGVVTVAASVSLLSGKKISLMQRSTMQDAMSAPKVGGIWLSVFHSVSAFCNAGFDILGTVVSAFPSLTGYSGNALINMVIMLLIIIWGVGFLTWDDIYTNKRNFKRYRTQSKIILVTTTCLILLPAVFFFTFDLKNLPSSPERTEKVDNTAYIWYNRYIKYRWCFYD